MQSSSNKMFLEDEDQDFAGTPLATSIKNQFKPIVINTFVLLVDPFCRLACCSCSLFDCCARFRDQRRILSKASDMF